MINFLTKKITRKRLDDFIKKHSSSRLALDLGCSNSPYSKYFPNRVGVDLKKGKRVDVIGDAHDLPFKDNTFDIILCTEVLEHLHTPQKAISEMQRVLKPKGKLILTTRFIFPLHDIPNDYFRFTKYGLKYLFKDWDILEIKEEVNTIQTFSVLLQRLAYQLEFKFLNKSLKFLLFLVAKILFNLGFVIKNEYGDILKKEKEENILSSGYYLVLQNRK